MRRYSWLAGLAVLLALAVPARGDSITSFHIMLGTWTGSSFVFDGGDWNTNGPGWAIGATAPGLGNTLLDSYQNVNLSLGEYYLYAAQTIDGGNAIELTVGLSNNTTLTEIFKTSGGGSALFNGGYTLVQGSGFNLGFVSGPESTYVPVGQGPTGYSGGTADWVLDFSDPAATPEPASAALLLTGIGTAGLISLGRRRRMLSGVGAGL